MRLRLLSMRMMVDSMIVEISSALQPEAQHIEEELVKDRVPKTFGAKRTLMSNQNQSGEKS